MVYKSISDGKAHNFVISQKPANLKERQIFAPAGCGDDGLPLGLPVVAYADADSLDAMGVTGAEIEYEEETDRFMYAVGMGQRWVANPVPGDVLAGAQIAFEWANADFAEEFSEGAKLKA